MVKIKTYKEKEDLESLTEAIDVFKQENMKKKLHFPTEYTDINHYKKNILGISDVVLAKENGITAGFAAGHQRNSSNSENYWLEIIYVLPGYRKDDVATQIMNNLIDTAYHRGYKRMQSRVSKDNHPSLILHKKLGFSKGRYDENIADKEEFYLMTKKIQ